MSFFGPVDPAIDAGHRDPPKRKGFFTDTSVCIGCKACEVACKEWNEVPDDGMTLSGMSYDNTLALGAWAWRHGPTSPLSSSRPAARPGPPPRVMTPVRRRRTADRRFVG
jgi:formate dehydrogenase iron-sulfur subunit